MGERPAGLRSAGHEGFQWMCEFKVRCGSNVDLTRFHGASGVGFFSPHALYDMHLLNGQRGPLTMRGVP